MAMTGTVFNLQRFSLFDGPGVRTVVFLKGCPLRCAWCHNPEGLSRGRQMRYNADRCIGCGACVEICPAGCHSLRQGMHVLDRSACVACGECAKECYSLALTAEGTEMTVDEVLKAVLRDAATYEKSGGGMTLSGGEPLLQGEFSLALLQAAKERGLHTCVETSGFGDGEILRQMAEVTDLFLFDYKITGEELHRKWCGVSQKPILENLARLENLGAAVILRCPILPDVNGTEEHLQGIAQTALHHPKSVKAIHIEPYHRLGISKAAQLGMKTEYEAEVPDKAWVEEFARRLREQCGEIPVVIN